MLACWHCFSSNEIRYCWRHVRSARATEELQITTKIHWQWATVTYNKLLFSLLIKNKTKTPHQHINHPVINELRILQMAPPKLNSWLLFSPELAGKEWWQLGITTFQETRQDTDPLPCDGNDWTNGKQSMDLISMIAPSWSWNSPSNG